MSIADRNGQSNLTVIMCSLDYLAREAKSSGHHVEAKLIRNLINRIEENWRDEKVRRIDEIMADGDFIKLLDFYYNLKQMGVGSVDVVHDNVRWVSDALGQKKRKAARTAS